MQEIHYNENSFHTYDHAAKRERGFEFTIDYEGRWYFHGGETPGPIRRKALAGLFGGAGSGFMAGKGLCIDEDGRYWLKSPESRYEVDVEDVPFVIKRLDVKNEGAESQAIDLYTDFDEKVSLDENHVPVLRKEPRHGVHVIYVPVRQGLLARCDRHIYNAIVQNYAEMQPGRDDGQMILQIRSYGSVFDLPLPEDKSVDD